MGIFSGLPRLAFSPEAWYNASTDQSERRMPVEKKRQSISAGLLILYGALMLWLLFWRERSIEGMPYLHQLPMHVNFHPLKTIRLYLGLLGAHRPSLVRIAVINLFGNVLMFVPLGFLLPNAFPRLGKWYRVLLTAAGIIVLVELLQMLFLVGTCDIDDLILNLMGTALGYGLFAALGRCENK